MQTNFQVKGTFYNTDIYFKQYNNIFKLLYVNSSVQLTEQYTDLHTDISESKAGKG